MNMLWQIDTKIYDTRAVTVGYTPLSTDSVENTHWGIKYLSGDTPPVTVDGYCTVSTCVTSLRRYKDVFCLRLTDCVYQNVDAVVLVMTLQGQGRVQWRAAVAEDVVDVAMPTDRRSAFPDHFHSIRVRWSISCLLATSNDCQSMYHLPRITVFSVVCQILHVTRVRKWRSQEFSFGRG